GGEWNPTIFYTGGTIAPNHAFGNAKLNCGDCHDPHGSKNVYHHRENSATGSFNRVNMNHLNSRDCQVSIGPDHLGVSLADQEYLRIGVYQPLVASILPFGWAKPSRVRITGCID
ncbi:MAG TPA: hypothetical protein VHS59_09335, partial [Bacillota bacterium]|nr:hypothetical protein [Bacillota bacterium]